MKDRRKYLFVINVDASWTHNKYVRGRITG